MYSNVFDVFDEVATDTNLYWNPISCSFYIIVKQAFRILCKVEKNNDEMGYWDFLTCFFMLHIAFCYMWEIQFNNYAKKYWESWVYGSVLGLST